MAKNFEKEEYTCCYCYEGYMGEELYRSIRHGNKKFEIYEESEHLFAYWDESERYMKSVISFIVE